MAVCVSWRRALLALLVAAGVSMATAVSANPINHGIDAPTPDVFSNDYVPPVPAGAAPGLGAQLYVSPRPVPPYVGRTWYTYPPFLPHEFLYRHHRRYIRPAGATGMRTEVRSFYW